MYAEEDEAFSHLKYSTTRINSDVLRLRKSKLAKAFFPNNDFINNTTTNNNNNTEMESLQAGDNNIAHHVTNNHNNADYCTEQNDDMLQVENNNNSNNNTIKQEMNGISLEIINPQEFPPLSKQPKRSSPSSSQVENGESQSSTSDGIQPRIPQYLLPFNQIDLQLVSCDQETEKKKEIK
ncbi:unnamed protein product [Trichobilharzia regenti]|nr:unnamed protein product [Trichobilharzia regenti]